MTFQAHAWQLAAVSTFERLGGLMLAMSPGSGKTLVLAECLAMGERPLLVCPASARAQTRRMFEGYGVTSGFVSYSQISRDSELLNRYKPDVIGLDESQALRNTRTSAWGRRIARYLHENPSCRVVASTGSVMHRSLVDYAHLLDWALRGGSPAPRSQAGIEIRARQVALDPEAWLATLRGTPGVFIDSAPSWAGELLIREHTLPVSDDSAYARAAETGMAPDGWAVEGWALTELLRQLSWGWYMGRDPRPSPRLVEARATWAKCVTQAKAYGLCDTELGARAHYPDAWRALQAVLTVEPEGAPVQIWLDPDAVVATVEGLLCHVLTRNSSGLESPVGQSLTAAESGSVTGRAAATAACEGAMPTVSRTSCTSALSPTGCSSAIGVTIQAALSPPICSSAQQATTTVIARPRAALKPALDTTSGPEAKCQLSSVGGLKQLLADSAVKAPESYSPTCIIWVQHVALGELLSARLCIPYHREGGYDAAGTRLDEARGRVVLASLSACSKAFNAQHFNAMIYLEPPADARVFQQSICRGARQGQKSPCVTVDIILSSPTYAADLATAKTLAAQIELETGQEQLLLKGVQT